MNAEAVRSMCMINDKGCWEKNGVKPNRYGSFRINGVLQRAHRVVWEQLVGAIPEGLYVCHRCNNKRCINPSHLYLATHQQNVIDAARDGLFAGRPPSRPNAKKTKCKRGHPLAGSNIRLSKNGKRVCRSCMRIYVKKYASGNMEKLRIKALARYYRNRKLAALAKGAGDAK